MHPVEHILYFSGVLIHWILPSHPIHVSSISSTSPSRRRRAIPASRARDQDGFNVKTGDYLLPPPQAFRVQLRQRPDADRRVGRTFHDGSKEAEERINERFMEQAKRMGKSEMMAIPSSRPLD
jgi:hypothetical protein